MINEEGAVRGNQEIRQQTHTRREKNRKRGRMKQEKRGKRGKD